MLSAPGDAPGTDAGVRVAAVCAAIVRRLEAAGVDSAPLDARLLVCAATGETAAGLIARPDRPLTAAEATMLRGLLDRRLAREPMAHILGRREFWSLEFDVSASVLTPRPDSETLIDAACRHIGARDRRFRALDLGTGSGCLLLALLHEFPAASGVGIDVSAAAVALARANAVRLGISGRAAFAVSDWAAAIGARFDVVVCNPPYIASGEIAALAPEVALYEPRGALDGGADGLAAYRVLLPALAKNLAPGGLALFEIGAGQGDAVRALAQANGFANTALQADLTGIARVAILRQR